MAERGPIEELDEAVDEVMANPEAPLPVLDARLADLLRIAADLRDLPSGEFRARLKLQLMPEAHEPKLVAYDLRTALRDLPEMSMRFLASLNQCTIGVSRGSTQTPLWERHPAGDELIHVLEGELEVTTLTPGGPVHTTVSAGSLFICRQGLWHWPRPLSPVSIFFATPGEGTENSSAEDPRARGSRGETVEVSRSATDPAIAAHDLRAALTGLPELAITSGTTAEEADAAVRTITSLGPCTIGLMRYSGLTPWERHPDGDELLHVLEGEVDVTVLTDDGPAHVTVGAGSVFVCPRGLWHRQLPRPSVTMLFGTPSDTSEVSFAEDPRTEA